MGFYCLIDERVNYESGEAGETAGPGPHRWEGELNAC